MIAYRQTAYCNHLASCSLQYLAVGCVLTLCHLCLCSDTVSFVLVFLLLI
jgi:hypothetical protein